jgi:hypothetical protein
MSVKGRLRLGTVLEACKVIGGESKPVHPSTYYRGVKKGRYSPRSTPLTTSAASIWTGSKMRSGL